MSECPSACPKRARCSYPKCSYDALSAEAAHRARLSSSRAGVAASEGELAEMVGIVAPLLRRGQSFEAIWAEHGGELPVGVRTACNYQAAGIFGVADLELPRKVRMSPRKKRGGRGRDRVGRTVTCFNMSDRGTVGSRRSGGPSGPLERAVATLSAGLPQHCKSEFSVATNISIDLGKSSVVDSLQKENDPVLP